MYLITHCSPLCTTLLPVFCQYGEGGTGITVLILPPLMHMNDIYGSQEHCFPGAPVHGDGTKAFTLPPCTHDVLARRTSYGGTCPPYPGIN